MRQVELPTVPHRDADVEVNVTLISDGQAVAECDCSVWLPRNARESVVLELGTFSTNLDWFGPYQLRGKVHTSNQRVVLTADDVWLARLPVGWPAEIHPRRTRLMPSRIGLLTVLKAIGEESAAPANTEATADSLTFRLSEVPYVFVGASQAFYPDGSVEVMGRRTLDVAHPALGTVRFDRVHKCSADERGTLLTSQLQAAILGFPGMSGPKAERTALSRTHMGDLCLLTSFAARHRLTVTGWQCSGDSWFEDCYLEPENPGRDAFLDDELIERVDDAEFLSAAAVRFMQLSEVQREAVRHAIRALHPTFDQSVEDSFRSLFSELESLMHAYRKPWNLSEAGGSPITWKALKDTLAGELDKFAQRNPAFDREEAAKQIRQMGGVSLKASAVRFFSGLAVNLSDLWPAFNGTKSSPALYDIRNRLSHGDRFADAKYEALMVALVHLRLLIERVVLRVLDYDVDKSNAARSALIERGVAGVGDSGRYRARFKGR